MVESGMDFVGESPVVQDPKGGGLSREEFVKLAKTPEFIEVLLDAVSRDERVLEPFVSAITETKAFKEAVARQAEEEFRGIMGD